jgi:hypothetical protein
MQRAGSRLSRQQVLAVAFALLLVGGAALGVSVRQLLVGGPPPNSAAAEALYWKTLDRVAAAPGFQIRETYVQRVPASKTQLHTGGTTEVSFRIRHISTDAVEVLMRMNSAASEVIPDDRRIVLGQHSLCVGDAETSFETCSPAHAMQVARYLADYLLGGQVAGIRFSRTTARSPEPLIIIQLRGRGALGCTPAGAGAGTKAGYRWCPSTNVQASSVSATLSISVGSGLPIAFSASGTKYGEPSSVRATFSYGGRYHVQVQNVRHVACLSWLPAIHCIELRHHKQR